MKKKMLSVIIALMPILASYRSIVPNVDLGTFLVVICLIICLIGKGKLTFDRNDKYVSVFLYIAFLTPILIFFSSGHSNIELPTKITAFLRWGKLMVAFMLPLTVTFKEQYSEQIAIKTMRIVSYAAIVIVIIQRVAYLLDTVIYNPLANFAISDAYSVENYAMVLGNELFRPSAFFLEPSHFTQYVIFYLIFSLFANVNNANTSSKKSNIIEAVVVMAGLFCTGSGMGFALALIIIAIYILISSKKNILKGILLLVSVGLACIFLYRTSFVQGVLERIFTDSSLYGGNALSARIGVGYQLFSELPCINKLIGYGYGNIPVDVYLNGLAYCLIAIGIVGTVLFLLCLAKMFRGNVLWKKISIMVYFVMVVFAQLFTPGNLLFVVVLLKKNLILDKNTV